MKGPVEDVPAEERDEDGDAAEVHDEAQDQRPEQHRVEDLLLGYRLLLVDMEDLNEHEARREHQQRDEGDEVDGDRPLAEETLAELERLDGENLPQGRRAGCGVVHEVGPSLSIRYR